MGWVSPQADLSRVKTAFAATGDGSRNWKIPHFARSVDRNKLSVSERTLLASFVPSIHRVETNLSGAPCRRRMTMGAPGQKVIFVEQGNRLGFGRVVPWFC
jgi:hypothetical protein